MRFMANKNKTRTSKVGAISNISKAQKAQNIFRQKKLETFENFFAFKKIRIVPKNVKGDPSGGFINIHSVAKYQKTRRVTLWDIEIFEKKLHSVKKIKEGDPLARPVL